MYGFEKIVNTPLWAILLVFVVFSPFYGFFLYLIGDYVMWRVNRSTRLDAFVEAQYGPLLRGGELTEVPETKVTRRRLEGRVQGYPVQVTLDELPRFRTGVRYEQHITVAFSNPLQGKGGFDIWGFDIDPTAIEASTTAKTKVSEASRAFHSPFRGRRTQEIGQFLVRYPATLAVRPQTLTWTVTRGVEPTDPEGTEIVQAVLGLARTLEGD